MVSRDEGRRQVQTALAHHLLQSGLGRISLRQLAAAAGISDRMLLYYYTDKAEVLTAAMAEVAAELAERLEAAVPAATVMGSRGLAAAAAQFTTGVVARPYMQLWIEVVAAAARREVPFPLLANQIAESFIAWTEMRLNPAGLADPRATAIAIVALIDGLAVIAVCADEALVKRAAASLGDLDLGQAASFSTHSG